MAGDENPDQQLDEERGSSVKHPYSRTGQTRDSARVGCGHEKSRIGVRLILAHSQALLNLLGRVSYTDPADAGVEDGGGAVGDGEFVVAGGDAAPLLVEGE